ncbi:hypothetical protein [Legionella waltersii]|uniref:Uncharacterized protein n=1 Tax=Legionella waltersii TaxID=66969 RepID=A0A0W1A2T2_9GAMM|nr:hypothetical protein [Legionella waltersii]KTD75698.1 hypothetical protein Lwal_2636 [Legionella waltersii]SNU99492.1 Uncharacterised protein [Legionella waltersii]
MHKWGATVAGTLVGVATGIGVAQTVEEMAYNQYKKSEFGDEVPATYLYLQQMLQLSLQEQLRVYKATVEESSQPERSRNLQKLVLGEASSGSRHAEGLVVQLRTSDNLDENTLKLMEDPKFPDNHWKWLLRKILGAL